MKESSGIIILQFPRSAVFETVLKKIKKFKFEHLNEIPAPAALSSAAMAAPAALSSASMAAQAALSSAAMAILPYFVVGTLLSATVLQ